MYDQGISTKILLEQHKIETSGILTNTTNIYQPNLARIFHELTPWRDFMKYPG